MKRWPQAGVLLFAATLSLAAWAAGPQTGKAAASLTKKEAAAADQMIQVKQQDWARALVRHLGYHHDPEALEMAEGEVFSLLSGVGEGTIRAAEYKKSLFPAKTFQSDEIAKGSASWVEAVTQPTTLYYFVPIPVSGRYFLRVYAKGPTKQYWNFQGEDSIRPVVTGRDFAWTDLPPFGVQAGIKKLGVSLPQGAGVEEIRYKGPCGAPVAPRGGWKPGQTIAYPEMLRTLFIAQVSVLGSRVKDEWPRDRHFTPLTQGPEKYTKSGKNSSRSIYRINLPSEGIYGIYSRSAGGAKRVWTVNQCGRLEVVPAPAKDKKAVQRLHLITRYFNAGPQTLEAETESGVVSDVMVVERMDDSPQALADLAQAFGLPPSGFDFARMLLTGKDAFAPIFQPIDIAVGLMPPPPPADSVPPSLTPGDGSGDNPVKDPDRNIVSPLLP